MKNISEHQSKVGYLVQTDPCGTQMLCPFCGNMNAFDFSDNFYAFSDTNSIKDTNMGFLADLEPCPAPYYYYCEKCKTVFANGCRYTDRDMTWNAHLIGKYSFEGETYIGMPLYETIDEWLRLSPKVQVIQWICPNGGKIDPNAKCAKELRKEKCKLHSKISQIIYFDVLDVI